MVFENGNLKNFWFYHNTLGQQGDELIHQNLAEEMKEVVLNADRLSSGTYLYLMEYGDIRLTRQLFIMK